MTIIKVAVAAAFAIGPGLLVYYGTKNSATATEQQSPSGNIIGTHNLEIINGRKKMVYDYQFPDSKSCGIAKNAFVAGASLVVGETMTNPEDKQSGGYLPATVDDLKKNYYGNANAVDRIDLIDRAARCRKL